MVFEPPAIQDARRFFSTEIIGFHSRDMTCRKVSIKER